MSPFEEELKRALARQEPSEDFTARVLAKVSAQRRPAGTRSWQWAAVAAATLIIAGSAGLKHQQEVHQHQQAMRGEAAKHQLLMALRIAGTKLQLAQMRVQESEVNQ
jgi:hypothetical protein